MLYGVSWLSLFGYVTCVWMLLAFNSFSKARGASYAAPVDLNINMLCSSSSCSSSSCSSPFSSPTSILLPVHCPVPLRLSLALTLSLHLLLQVSFLSYPPGARRLTPALSLSIRRCRALAADIGAV